MKTPLNYQITEYDCAPTSVLNAIAYLFDREEIQPDIPKFVSLYTLDTYGERGLLGKEGTSKMAMQFLCAWLNQYSEATGFAIETEYLSGENVAFNPNSKLVNGIADGGVAVVRVMDECWHYVLSVGIEKENVVLFDPYFESKHSTAGIEYIGADDGRSNRKVSFERLNSDNHRIRYATGKTEEREAVLFFNKKTRKARPNGGIEYFI